MITEGQELGNFTKPYLSASEFLVPTVVVCPISRLSTFPNIDAVFYFPLNFGHNGLDAPVYFESLKAC